MYGVSTSPILHQDLVVLVVDDDADLPGIALSRSRILALDAATGEIVWETPRPYNRGAWSTPMVWTHESGSDLVVLGNGRAYGYALNTGAERWYVNGFAREPISVPVAGDGLLFLSVSMQGGRGDASLDPDPFWNRVSALRMPAEVDAFEARLAELLALFAGLDRRPHLVRSVRLLRQINRSPKPQPIWARHGLPIGEKTRAT